MIVAPDPTQNLLADSCKSCTSAPLVAARAARPCVSDPTLRRLARVITALEPLFSAMSPSRGRLEAHALALSALWHAACFPRNS